MINVYYSPAYAGAEYEYSTTRKARWIVESLERDPIDGVKIVAPEPLTFDQVAQVHDASYVRAVQTGEPRRLAESQGFDWGPGLWNAVLASNGGTVAAALDAMKNGVAGSLSSGMHHAGPGAGGGFCTFNGLAIAAKAAIAAGARSVLIADLDAHCGGGTHSLIVDDEKIWQLDISVSSVDRYAPTARNTLDFVSIASDYLPTIERRFAEIEASVPGFDLCLYNSGMDPHEDCSLGGLKGIDIDVLRERERFVFEWCARLKVPVAFTLAGGYIGGAMTTDALVGSHRLTLGAASM